MTVKFIAESVVMHYLNGEEVNEEDAANIVGGGAYPSEIVDFCPVTWVFVIDLEDQLILVAGVYIDEDCIGEFIHPEEAQDYREAQMTNQNEQERDALLLSNSTYTQEDNLNNAMVRTPEWKFKEAAHLFYATTLISADVSLLRHDAATDALSRADALLKATPEYKAWKEAQDD